LGGLIFRGRREIRARSGRILLEKFTGPTCVIRKEGIIRGV